MGMTSYFSTYSVVGIIESFGIREVWGSRVVKSLGHIRMLE